MQLGDRKKQKGIFILSLDCEGLWGMADKPEVVGSGVINRRSLCDCYGVVCDTLALCGVRATAAFVSCFAAGPARTAEQLSILREMARINPRWFTSILRCIETQSWDGWSGTQFFEDLKAVGCEMAWHGASHVPLDASTPSALIELEIELARAVLFSGEWPRTIVFPRNRIGHLGMLRRCGFDTYRDAHPSTFRHRIVSLANEFNVKQGGRLPGVTRKDGWYISPAGSFLNWPSGIRATVPVSVTKRRWKSMLKNAADNGGTVHMWFHPHNLVTAPRMRYAFQEVLAYAGTLARQGTLLNLTMGEANEFAV